MKCMSGAARLGVGFGIAVMLFSLIMLYSPPVEAHPAVNGTISFNASTYYTDSIAVITLIDSPDLTADTQSITVNSTTCPTPVSLSLLKSGSVYNNTITFITTGSCGSHSPLKVSDGDTVMITYNDTTSPEAEGYVVFTNTSTFDYTENATIWFNQTIYGTLGMGNITVVDNDTNADATDWDTINVTIKASSSSSIIVTLNETPSDLVYGNNTGIFYGTFTFNSTGTGSNDSADLLGVSEGDIIWVYYNDTKNTYGIALNVTNTSSMAATGTVAFDSSSFYPDYVAYVSVHDNDTLANTNWLQNDTLVVNITSEYDPDGINVTLTETDNDTGIFNGSFTFNSSGSSNDATDVLGAFNNNKINVTYFDSKNGTGETTSNVTNTSTFYHRASATISLDVEYYGPESIVRVTVTDNDTATGVNTDHANKNSVNVFVNTSSNTTGMTISLLENASDDGVFLGNFTFNVSGITNDSADFIAASDLDQVFVIYTDVNSTGNTLNISDNATFHNSVTGNIDFNATFLNATESAYPANATVLLNVSDNDTYANTNSGSYQEVNVTVRNMDTGCSITITLNETGADTGVFNGTFNLNGTCSDANDTMDFTAGDEDYLNITYIDNRNGTASPNGSIYNLTLADDKAPVFISVTSLDSDLVYNPGDMINISIQLDQLGGNLSVNFSVIDSGYVTGAENVTDWGNGTYMINYTISSGTSIKQGNYALNITAYDAVGNGPASDTSFSITLSKLSINLSLLNFTSLAPKGSYKVIFNISNDGDVAQYNMTEHIEVYREANLTYDTNLNGTRLLHFMVPQNATRITFSLGSNHSSTVISSRLYDNSNSLQSSSLSGTIYPSVARDSAEVWYMRVTVSNVTPTIKVTPNVRIYINATDWFNSSLTAGADNLSANSNTTISLNLTIPILNVLPSIYNGTVIYNNSNTSVSVPLTFNITGPQVWYESNASSPVKNLPNGSIMLSVNLMRGFRTLKIDINNTGNINLTGVWANLTEGTTTKTNFTDPSNRSINISAVTGSAGSDVSTSRHNMTFIPVTPGSSGWIKLQFNTSEQTTEGIYSTYLNIYSANGQPFNESSLTLQINLTSVLNVTILNVSYKNQSVKALPGDNITINLSVKYQNGDAVAGLVLGNFSIYDTWTTGSGSARNRTSGNLSVHDFSLNGSGFYMFNYTVPDRSSLGKAEYELHSIILEAWASNSNIGNGSSVYNLSAPNINMSFNSFLAAMSNQTTDAFSINIANNGSVIIYNVSVNFTKNDTTNACITLNVTSCPVIDNITVNENVAACSVLVSANTSACTANITFKAGGVSIFGTEYNATQTSKIIEVSVVSGGTSNGGTTGGGDIPSTCTSDSSCSALYFCNATSYCERITCTDGFIANHKCVKYTYGVRILSYEPSIYVLLGLSNTTEINVNNAKNTTTIKTELSLSTITGSVSPSEKVIASHQNQTFNVTISAPNETAIGNYSVTFLAYRSGNKSINDSISFTVVVMPHEERIVEINYTYENYSSIVEGLEMELEELKAGGFVSMANLTVAERHVNNTRLVLNEIDAAINEGDYAKAEGLFSDLETYINDARAALDNLKLEHEARMEESQGALIIWIIVGMVIAVAAGFLIYMFLPSRGVPSYKISKGVPKPGILTGVKGGLSGIGGRFRKPKSVTHKLKDYARGYERHKGLRYEYKEGIGEKLKKLFKRKK